MSISRKVRFLGLAGLLSLASVVGCGSTDNNDQGTVFTALGYFGATSADSAAVDTEKAIGYAFLPLSSPVGLIDGGAQFTWIGVSNNLVTEGTRNPYIRATRINCSYFVPGSTLSIPDEEFATSGIIEGGTGSAGGSTEGGDATGGAAQSAAKAIGSGTAYLPFPLVSSDIYAYLNNNRTQLPELPFEMVASCNVTGVTRAGETYTTNNVDITIQFVESAEVNPVDDSTEAAPAAE